MVNTMYDTERKLYQLLMPVRYASSVSKPLVWGEFSVFSGVHAHGILYDTWYMRVSSESTEFWLMVDVYHQGFARVSRLKRAGERTVYGKLGKIWHPVNMAKLNQEMVDFFESQYKAGSVLMGAVS